MRGRHPNSAPAIEEIQDIVETVLIEAKERTCQGLHPLQGPPRDHAGYAEAHAGHHTTMDGYLSQSTAVNENANDNFSLGVSFSTIPARSPRTTG
jgi:ribonucleoside-triphosphate reductase